MFLTSRTSGTIGNRVLCMSNNVLTCVNGRPGWLMSVGEGGLLISLLVLTSSLCFYLSIQRAVGDVGGVFLTITATLTVFSYSRGRPIAIAVAGPLSVSEGKRVIRVSVTRVANGLRLPSATRIVMLSRGKLRMPCRVACSSVLVFPTSIGKSTSTICAVTRKAPRPISIITYKHRCPRHLSSIT